MQLDGQLGGFTFPQVMLNMMVIMRLIVLLALRRARRVMSMNILDMESSHLLDTESRSFLDFG